MKFPQKQHELTNGFFIIIILALLHFTDGKKTLLHQSFFQWILLLSQVEACLKIFQMEDLLCNVGGEKSYSGPNSDTSWFVQIYWAPTSENEAFSMYFVLLKKRGTQ